ncbi:MAG TPA: hypothetical protein V6D10_20675 [Trichocoleus sp.]|jgi:hypothetical protein
MSEVVAAAKAHIVEFFINHAYPIVPTDAFGNGLDYEPGCVPWVSCRSITVKNAEHVSSGQDIHVVKVYADLEWFSEQDGKCPDPDACFQVYVPTNGDEFFFGRVD